MLCRAHIIFSDTTSSILTNLFFELARNRELLAKLQKQLDELSEINDTTLRGIELLDGVIYEGLRLHPPVPSGLQRVTPEEGIMIGNTFIPGNTIVQVPHYTSFRGTYVLLLAVGSSLIMSR